MSTYPTRCSWAVNDLLVAYHDQEYGRMTTTDRDIFERICLESFSAGLSWYLILRKRDALRSVFAQFDVSACAALTDAALAAACKNADIVRNARKIYAVRSNAQICLQLIAEFGSLIAFIEQFEDPQEMIGCLKKRGIRQFGPVGAQELFKSLGLLPAHEEGCFLHAGSTAAPEVP